MQQFHGTAITGVRDAHSVALGGDGQVSLGDTVMKGNAVKVRALSEQSAGSARHAADAFTLFEKFEAALEKYHGQLTCNIELAKNGDLTVPCASSTMLIVADTTTLLIGGNGDVIEPEHGVLAIGWATLRRGGNCIINTELGLQMWYVNL